MLLFHSPYQLPPIWLFKIAPRHALKKNALTQFLKKNGHVHSCDVPYAKIQFIDDAVSLHSCMPM